MLLTLLVLDDRIDIEVKFPSPMVYDRCYMPNNKPSTSPKITGSGPFGQAGVNPSGTVQRSDYGKITVQRSGSQEKAVQRPDHLTSVTKK